ncbi:MAG TPA: 16S rRNA (cytosine(967)-C(5))-methyltransferase RsmB, partial [Polyangia bacterium]|nr:16S rRNA (cytosine(967)-C(5))-methyltransferase RsmB [Polyangia bacterium]
LKVLTRVEADGAHAAAALAAELAGVGDSRETALCTELVYGVLRRRPWLDHLIESAAGRPLDRIDPATRRILRIAAYQLAFLERIPARAAVFEAVEQARRRGSPRLAGLVNAVLRKLAGRERAELAGRDPGPDAPFSAFALAHGLPAWLVERLVTAHGDAGARAMATAFDRPAPRTLRVNLARTTRDALLVDLGETARLNPVSPWAIDVADARAARRLEEDGRAVHQDAGAQLAVLALDAGPGCRVLDACAGRGGKTGALAALVGEAGRVVAADRQESKLLRLALELHRLGLEAETVAGDLTGAAPALGGPPFDRVLIDAPCSGSGTLGRRPDIRWRIDERKVASLVELQWSLLVALALRVAPGGRLVFAVCSVLPEEGRFHGPRFLDAHPDFSFVEFPPGGWPGMVPWNGGSILVDPAVTGGDGYQIICLERRSSPPGRGSPQ